MNYVVVLIYLLGASLLNSTKTRKKNNEMISNGPVILWKCRNCMHLQKRYPYVNYAFFYIVFSRISFFSKKNCYIIIFFLKKEEENALQKVLKLNSKIVRRSINILNSIKRVVVMGVHCCGIRMSLIDGCC